ncbi:hypothetical protein LH464_22570 [Neorhizobium sp. T786]|uniref:hypothetical protein n=1 Tax=Pseudorhizobium xiangyangii TaxID=2883104 RepID=UPI001CFFB078|nr:hypothetical protein [Neorhizobium xiangyangii]MCB5205252.1 hypothetical protein [Neorhizobium xiangyangii]
MSIQSLPAFFPWVMTPRDLDAMTRAYRLAMKAQAASSEPAESDAMSRIVYRLYSKGLTDPGKLAALAQLMAASPYFQR